MKKISETEIWPADSNEAGLRTDMVAAFRASNDFVNWILYKTHPKANVDGLTSNASVEQRLENSIIDIDLKFTGPKNYRIGIELKNGTADVEVDQLERHLVGLKIKQKKRRVLTKSATDEKKIVKLLVITGASTEPDAVKELKELNGFNDKLIWMSWHTVVDRITQLPEKIQENPNIKPLISNLNNLGFSSNSVKIKRLKTIDKVSRLFEDIHVSTDKFHEELDVLDAILNRIDFEMNIRKYSNSQELKIKKLPRNKLKKTFSNFMPSHFRKTIDDTKIRRWIGRMYVPQAEIQLLKTETQNKKINYGVAIGYNLVVRKWTCILVPKSTHPIDRKIFSALSSNSKTPIRNSNSWELKGTHLKPTTLSKFLVDAWVMYEKSSD